MKDNIEIVFSSVEEKERIIALDVLRGVAILGILLVNMKSFSNPDTPIRALSYEYFDEYYDVWTNIALEFFVQGNFITMFSFLFGFGMVLMAERAKEKDSPFVPAFLRRQMALLLFGVLHVLFFWYGDILITYTISGLVMLLLYKGSARKLAIIGSVLLILYSLFITASTYFYWSSGAALDYQATLNEQYVQEIEASIQIYSEGSFQEILKERVREWLDLNQALFLFVWGLLPMFLFGAYAAKKRPYPSKTLWKISIATGILGLGSKIIPVLMFSAKGLDWRFDTAMAWGYEFGGALMSLFYICSIVLLYRASVKAGKFKQLFNFFQATGRMAFTNYLAQSIISCTTIFYSYGLGLYGQFGPLAGVGIAFIIFSFQAILSRWWLKRYYAGPLEWIWRILTYGKIPKFKKSKRSAS